MEERVGILHRRQGKWWLHRLALAGLLVAVSAPGGTEEREGGPMIPSVRMVERPGEKLLTVSGRLSEPEIITTGAGEIGHILLSDQTSLTIGPHADVTLDAFAYSPGQPGRLELTLRRGLLRVVGGRLARQADIVIRTPAATLTTRTGVVLIEVGNEEGGQARIDATLLHGEGVTLVQPDGAGRTITRSGFQARASAGGISDPVRVNPDIVLQRLQRLDSRRSSHPPP